MMPRPQESNYEIAYVLLGRCSIFVVCTVQLVNCFAVMVLYYIVIGDTLGELLAEWWVSRSTSTELGTEQTIEQIRE